jgi:hypothetical protein
MQFPRFGVGAGPVPADDLHAGVGGQPVGQRLGVAALDKVQRGTGLAVDQQRAVVLAAPDREVVDLSGVLSHPSVTSASVA